MSDERFRTETDSMGEVALPAWAMYGAQTQRAVDNFPISTLRAPRVLVRALAKIKRHSALANRDLGELDEELAQRIAEASGEVADGEFDRHFPVDVFQTGSGTSWNMNINEVIANRVNTLLGRPLGAKDPVHPNDHVNRGQSSNDVIPTAIQIANRITLDELSSAVAILRDRISEKAVQFAKVLKLGRTHLQDAVPMTLGQEFSGYAAQFDRVLRLLEAVKPELEQLPLGGTAVGTGLNAHPEFAERAIASLAEDLGIPFVPAANRFELIASRDPQLALMGAINVLAAALMRVSEDLRLLASGPRAGLGEIILPDLQPGSSIMPGKVNPVIPEAIIQVAAHLHGKVSSVTFAAERGPLELNMMQPLIAFETISALEIGAHGCRVLAEKAIVGIVANEGRAADWIEWSLAMVTPLARVVGYDRAAELAHRAYTEGRKIRDILVDEKVIADPAKLDELLDPARMVRPS